LRAARPATGSFYDDWKSRSGEFVHKVIDAKSVSTGTVAGAGLESLNSDRATVLVAVSVKTSLSGQPSAEPKRWRMRITVVKTNDGYKVSNVELVP
jgi:Mce-associated membrane protein